MPDNDPAKASRAVDLPGREVQGVATLSILNSDTPFQSFKLGRLVRETVAAAGRPARKQPGAD